MLGIPLNLFAQVDEVDLLGDDKPQVEKVAFAFKTTKVINLQSLETTDRGVLDFKMMHRFGEMNRGPVEAFGLDLATVRFGLEYGLTENAMISMGRSNVNGLKNTDVFLKYRVLHQTSDNSMPFSLLLLAGAQYALINPSLPAQEKPNSWQRSSFVFQTIFGRKFSERLSAVVVPTFINNAKNESWLFPKESIKQNIWALGLGFRYKLNARTSINGEYIPILATTGNSNQRLSSTRVYNSLSVGVDIETGGHVFQLHLTNSAGLNETQFVGNTQTSWQNTAIRLGFNLSRVFTIVQ
jgi:hypothetical protein